MQPCVRPVYAVHMTAGYNALRGSGPGQFPAFENAVAQVGCPDRRIDWLFAASPNMDYRSFINTTDLVNGEALRCGYPRSTGTKPTNHLCLISYRSHLGHPCQDRRSLC